MKEKDRVEIKRLVEESVWARMSPYEKTQEHYHAKADKICTLFCPHCNGERTMLPLNALVPLGWTCFLMEEPSDFPQFRCMGCLKVWEKKSGLVEVTGGK